MPSAKKLNLKPKSKRSLITDFTLTPCFKMLTQESICIKIAKAQPRLFFVLYQWTKTFSCNRTLLVLHQHDSYPSREHFT
jgi:hypothetical protein